MTRSMEKRPSVVRHPSHETGRTDHPYISRRRTDILQHEADHGRLSAAALGAGRGIEDALATLHRSPGGTWAERVDAPCRGDGMAANAVDAARRVTKIMERVERIVGPVDARLLRLILGEGHDFAEVAALDGRSGDREKAYVARRFRDALEELAKATAATGPIQPKVNDRYSAAADAVSRQDA